MVYHSEEKLQGWRALAIYEDGGECLIFLGRSTTQVRTGYAAAYAEILDEEERLRVQKVLLQCWNGAPDEGRWITKSTLNIPLRERVAVTESADEPEFAAVLPFRRPLVELLDEAV